MPYCVLLVAFLAPIFGSAEYASSADLPPRDPYRQYFFLPPADDAPTRDADAAEQAFAAAKSAAAAGQFTSAIQRTYEALHHDAQHAAARKLLGYRLVDGRWTTLFGATKRRADEVWHDRFGWLPRNQVARYEAGERYFSGRWIAPEEDARLHATIEKGWKIDTEHFRLTTNVGLEEGVRLAAKLESLWHVWRQAFARYHTLDVEWKRLFAGGDPREQPAKRFPVVFFRSKEEYVAALKKREPLIDMTSGIFMNDNDTAYFFADDKADHEPFLFHEVVHELFMLSRPTALQPAAKGNFWIIEGIACYFESLKLHDRYAELGDPANARLAAARYRRLVDDFYVPLAELTTFSRTQLQQDSRIARLYSQSSGLTWYLMHADDGRRREALVEYLAAVYAGKDTPTTLAEHTGEKYDALDRAYRSYLENLPPQRPAK